MSETLTMDSAEPVWKGTRWPNYLAQGWFLFYRDFQWVYSLTYFGYIWSIIRPLAAALPLIFIGNEFQLGSGKGDVPYFLYAFTGFVLWSVFWDSLTQPSNMLYRSRTVLRRMPLDGRAILVASLFNVLYHLAVNSIVALGAVLVLGVPLSWNILLLIFTVPLLALGGLAIGLPFASVGIIYQDIRYGIGFLGTILLWSAPILHEIPPQGKLHVINTWNPLTYLIDLPRSLIFGLPYEQLGPFAAAAAIVLVAFFLGYRFYLKKLPIGFDYVV